MRFINREGDSRFGRYRILPEAGNQHLSDAEAAKLGPNFLFEEFTQRVSQRPVRFRLYAQLANPGDVVDDATIHWPEDRTILELGTISLEKTVAADEAEQRKIIFDPIPRVDGIDASEDPLLELRAAVYLISGRRRRSATTAASAS
jgi:catalase